VYAGSGSSASSAVSTKGPFSIPSPGVSFSLSVAEVIKGTHGASSTSPVSFDIAQGGNGVTVGGSA